MDEQPKKEPEKGDEIGEEQESSIGRKITLAGLSTLQKIVVGVVVALGGVGETIGESLDLHG